jgi:hypothetical protein
MTLTDALLKTLVNYGTTGIFCLIILYTGIQHYAPEKRYRNLRF